MDRRIIINTPNKVLPIVVGAEDTIGSVKAKIWSQHPNAFDGLSPADFTFGPLPYQQIVHEDSYLIHDLLTWNHLFQLELPEVESVDFLSMDKKSLDNLRVSAIGNQLATNNGKIKNNQDDFRDSTTSADDDDDGFDLSRMLSFDPDQPALPNDTNIKKSPPAQLYLNKAQANKSTPPKAFQPQQTYHFLRLCNQKVKGFVSYGYEQRFIAIQGYMIYIYKGLKEFFGGIEPIEILHIGGLSIYNTCQRSDDNSSATKYQLVLKSNELHLPGPSPLALSVALSGAQSATPTSPYAIPSNTPMSPKSPTAGGNAKDEVVFLTPEPMAPNDDLICGAFKRDNMSRPGKGFLVLTFDDLMTHQAVYKFLNALKFQWLTEISVTCATICERRQVWTSEGIFRLSASAQQLEETKLQLYQGLYTDIDKFLDEHMYSGLMKTLLRELSDGPFLTSLYRLWLDVILDQEKYEKDHNLKEAVANKNQLVIDRCQTHLVQGVRSVSKKLPYYCHNYLGFLFPLLHHVSRFSHGSKMHFQQLSIVFGPNLVKSPVGRGTLQQQADNQLKINDLVSKIIEHGYHLFTPMYANAKPVHHVIMYDLHQPKYLNSIMDDYVGKEHSSPATSPSNMSSGNGSFFTPQVRRESLATALKQHGQSKDDALFMPNDLVSSSIAVDTLNFQHFDPRGGFIDPEEQSVAGSFYDSNRHVPLPDEFSTPGSNINSPTNALPLPPLPSNDLLNTTSVSLAESTIGLRLDTETGAHQVQNLLEAEHDAFDHEAFRVEQENERLKQQQELEAEQLAEYQRLRSEQDRENVEQSEKKAKMAAALGAILPFLNALNDDISTNPTFRVSPDLEQSVFEGLQSLQTASEIVEYIKKNPQL